MKKARFIKSGKLISGKGAIVFVDIGIARWVEDEVIYIKEDENVSDEVIEPIQEEKPVVKKVIRRKKRKKRTSKK